MFGTRLLEENENNLPEYQFILIGDSREAQGAAPVVWLFEKLTRNEKIDDADKDAVGSSSLTRVYPKINKDGAVSFEADAFINIIVSFPSLMMRLLPVSLDKFEEQGSASIQRVVEKSVRPSMVSFSDAFKVWVNTKIN